jgi:sucrose-6-phosphate hydrolase SacC (GH32 family)
MATTLKLCTRLMIAAAVTFAAGAAISAAETETEAQERSFVIEKGYLNLPVRTGAAVRKVSLLVDGRIERSFDIRLADATPDWWAFVDVSPWRGRTVTVRVEKLPEDSQALALIAPGDAIKGGEDLYRERLRPQFHFSSRRGWNNDPNGLVFYRGEYHLFYQHNPYGWEWGNMHWGHAVSRDLVHWDELGYALAPDASGPMFSGSAVVDRNNTSGLGTEGRPPLILLYTAAGRPTVQCLAYSNDGRSFTKDRDNPVVPQITPGNRDPKVIWHEPSQRWVMVLYVGLPDPTRPAEKGRPAQKHTIHFLTSPNLKEWTVRSQVEGFYECPDFFELPVEGDATKKFWVLSAANSDYILGRFDGSEFIPETPILTGQRGSSFYAPQTFSDLPDGRRVQIGWGRMPSPGMPFNQMMCFPCTLTLHPTADGPRLRWWPVAEIARLHAREHTVSPLPQQLAPGANPLAAAGIGGELFDIEAEFEVDDATSVGLMVRGTEVAYDAGKRTLRCLGREAPLVPEGGRVRLRILSDRTSLEVFGDNGMIYMPMAVIPRDDDRSVAVFARGGTATLRALVVHELNPIWPAPPGD